MMELQRKEIWLVRGTFLFLLAAGVAGYFDEYVIHLLIIGLIFTLLAIGQNIAFGYTGQLLLCQAAFFGIAAYGSALFVERLGISVWMAFPVATLTTAAFGALVGLIASRTSGHYFAMFTMSISIIFHQLVLNWDSLTHGALGLRDIPRPSNLSLLSFQLAFDNKRTFLLLCLLIVWISTEGLKIFRASRAGRMLIAVREDEIAAKSLGIKTTQVKVLAMTLAAALAGIAGPLYAHYRQLISPEDFTVFQSVLILLMIIMGGSGSLAGPLIGAMVVTLLPEYLRPVADYRWIVFGTALIICVTFLPGGISGGLQTAGRRILKWKK
jgi:branched-chain amino acid transport system permease protein